MVRAIHAGARRNPFGVVVWCSWACVAYFAFGWAVLKGIIDVPVIVQFASLLSGAVVAFGGVLAVIFLTTAARRRPALLNGVAALGANAALLAFFVYSLP